MVLFKGSPFSAPIPTDKTIWQWLFETNGEHAKYNSDQQGGFRDALTQEFLSFQDVKTHATHLSTSLAEVYGFGPGSRVSIFCSNSIWYPVAVFSALRLGGIVTGSSPEFGVDEMSYIIEASDSNLIYADATSWDVAVKAAAAAKQKPKHIIFLGDKTTAEAHGKAPMDIHDLIRRGSDKGLKAQVSPWQLNGRSNGEFPAFLSFTSGTTSRPKGVMISHFNVLGQLTQMRSLTPQQDCPKSLLGVLPLFHITGIVQILQLPLLLNQEVVIMNKFNLQEMLDVIMKFRCDELWLVPPLLIRLVNDPIARPYDLKHVKQFNTGAAPLSKEIITKLADRFRHVRIRQAWGMTESTSALTLTPPGDQTYENAHTVGKVVPGTFLKLVDVEDPTRELGVGETGEVLAKGPQVSMGYYKQPEATRETYDSDGFLHTGDIGFMDSNGFLTINDRLKEMIKVKGIAVAPAELEDLLLGHPDVADCAVIGIADDYAGEIPRAFVSVADAAKSKSLDSIQQSLIDFVKTNKSRPKWLAGAVEFIDVVPKSASGKILRRVLRNMVEEKARKLKSKL